MIAQTGYALAVPVPRTSLSETAVEKNNLAWPRWRITSATIYFYFFPIAARQVSRRTPMSEEAREVALAEVARSPKAEMFTGADLQAVVDTAQLAAIHSYLEARTV